MGSMLDLKVEDGANTVSAGGELASHPAELDRELARVPEARQGLR
jgi:hypothetical protein